VYIGVKDGKIYHEQFCPYAGRIVSKNRKYFYTLDAAQNYGYHSCKFCSQTGKAYSREKYDIEDFARKHQLDIRFEDNAVYVRNGVNNWMILAANKDRKMVLLHANSRLYKNLPTKNGRIIHSYHIQDDVIRKSIMGYLNYIVRHDDWRFRQSEEYKELPKVTKKQRNKYKKEKGKADKKAIRNVLNLIEEMQAERIYKEAINS